MTTNMVPNYASMSLAAAIALAARSDVASGDILGMTAADLYKSATDAGHTKGGKEFDVWMEETWGAKLRADIRAEFGDVVCKKHDKMTQTQRAVTPDREVLALVSALNTQKSRNTKAKRAVTAAWKGDKNAEKFLAGKMSWSKLEKSWADAKETAKEPEPKVEPTAAGNPGDVVETSKVESVTVVAKTPAEILADALRAALATAKSAGMTDGEIAAVAGDVLNTLAAVQA